MPGMASTFGDALKESLIALGGVRTKAEIAAWIRKRYPGRWKTTTLDGHLNGCRVNNPKAYQHHRSQPKFMFTAKGSGRYEMYDATKHGTFRNGHLLPREARPAEAHPSHPVRDSWIFQFLPDHNFDFEDTLESGLVLTW